MRLRTILVAAAALSLAAPATAAADPVHLLPDIVEGPPAQVSTYADSSSGTTQYELIFASSAQNFGDGPMALHGQRTASTDPMTVTQLIKNGDGSTTSQPVSGAMQYVPGPTHQHFHYLGFEHYELHRASDDQLMAGDHKTGFCLGDVYSVVANPPARQFQFAGWCQQNKPNALTVDMGITNGWEDIYDPQKEGQYVVVDGLPAGDYYLVNRANEDQSLLETNYANDASSALVHLSWPHGTTSLPSVSVLRTCTGFATCPLPVPGTGDATGVGATDATLTGTANPNGDGASYAFDYGGPAYGLSTARQALDPGNSPVPVSASVSGLAPNTTYHFRLNVFAAGTFFSGADRTFTTTPLPPAPGLPQSPIQPPAQAPPGAGAPFQVRYSRSLAGGRALLRLTLPGPGTAYGIARAHGLSAGLSEVGSGSRRIRRQGTVTLRLRPTRAGVALMRTERRVATRVTVIFVPAHGRRRMLHLNLSLGLHA